MLWWNPELDKKADKEAAERQRAVDLLDSTAKIEETQHAWYELNHWFSTLYSNREMSGFHWGARSNNADSQLWPHNLRTENLIENIGQAMLSKASSSPLRPTLVPHGNSWETARAVRKADRFMAGAWEATRAENACVEAFNDSYTSGLGCVQVSYDRDSVHVESVFFDNIVIDNEECSNRAMPRTYRVRKAMRRDVIEARYGITLDVEFKDKKSKLYNKKRAQGKDWEVVVEAFRLPDHEGKGGRHSIACTGYSGFIKDEPWEHEWVPLVFHRWQDRQDGFLTKGGVEQVVPFQIIQNELNDDIHDAQDLGCRLRILAHANSNIDWDQFDNKNGRVILYSGIEPKPWEMKTNLSELYNERERNKAAAYSHVGLSEMFAGADLPAQVRLDSSAAVREQSNREDARHLRLWSTFEQMRLDVGRTILLVIAAEDGADNYSVRPAMGDRLSTGNIPWKAIEDLTKEQYTWTLEPVAKAMQSPAARREMLRDNASRGQSEAGGDDARRMVSHSDIEMIEELELADREDIERHMGIMEEGGYEEPDEFTALSKGLFLVKANMKRLLNYDDVTKEDLMIRNHEKWLIKAGSIIVNAKKIEEMQMMQMQGGGGMVPFQPTQGVNGTSSAQSPTQ